MWLPIRTYSTRLPHLFLLSVTDRLLVALLRDGVHELGWLVDILLHLLRLLPRLNGHVLLCV